MTESVIAKAQELAKAISLSHEYITMRVTEDAAARDPKVTEAYGRYAEVQQKIEEISLQSNPDFDQMGELTRELETIQAEIQAMPMAQAMQNARKGFTDMMAAVNDELSKVLNPNYGKETGENCTGNCATCGGHCHG